MNTNQAGWIVVLLTLIIGLLAGVLYLTLSEANELPAWEYRIVSPGDSDARKTISEMGDKGWELASARRFYNSSTQTGGYEIIFKRQFRKAK